MKSEDHLRIFFLGGGIADFFCFFVFAFVVQWRHRKQLLGNDDKQEHFHNRFCFLTTFCFYLRHIGKDMIQYGIAYLNRATKITYSPLRMLLKFKFKPRGFILPFQSRSKKRASCLQSITQNLVTCSQSRRFIDFTSST